MLTLEKKRILKIINIFHNFQEEDLGDYYDESFDEFAEMENGSGEMVVDPSFDNSSIIDNYGKNSILFLKTSVTKVIKYQATQNDGEFEKRFGIFTQ